MNDTTQYIYNVNNVVGCNEADVYRSATFQYKTSKQFVKALAWDQRRQFDIAADNSTFQEALYIALALAQKMICDMIGCFVL